MELAPPVHVLRVGGGSDVERARGRRPPIQQQRFVIVLRVEQAEAADIEPFARNGIQPAETQPFVRDVQPLHLFGHGTHLGVPVRQRLGIARQRGAELVFGSRALGVEPRVEPGHVALLGPQFFFVPSS